MGCLGMLLLGSLEAWSLLKGIALLAVVVCFLVSLFACHDLLPLAIARFCKNEKEKNTLSGSVIPRRLQFLCFAKNNTFILKHTQTET